VIYRHIKFNNRPTNEEIKRQQAGGKSRLAEITGRQTFPAHNLQSWGFNAILPTSSDTSLNLRYMDILSLTIGWKTKELSDEKAGGACVLTLRRRPAGRPLDPHTRHSSCGVAATKLRVVPTFSAGAFYLVYIALAAPWHPDAKKQQDRSAVLLARFRVRSAIFKTVFCPTDILCWQADSKALCMCFCVHWAEYIPCVHCPGSDI